MWRVTRSSGGMHAVTQGQESQTMHRNPCYFQMLAKAVRK